MPNFSSPLPVRKGHSIYLLRVAFPYCLSNGFSHPGSRSSLALRQPHCRPAAAGCFVRAWTMSLTCVSSSTCCSSWTLRCSCADTAACSTCASDCTSQVSFHSHSKLSSQTTHQDAL